MTHRALIADDTEDMRLLLRFILGSCGWTVGHEAIDGQEAHQAWLAARDEFDALVLDHNMPNMTGLALAEAVRSHDSSVPILIVSAYLNPELRERAKHLNLTCVDKIDAARLGEYLPA